MHIDQFILYAKYQLYNYIHRDPSSSCIGGGLVERFSPDETHKRCRTHWAGQGPGEFGRNRHSGRVRPQPGRSYPGDDFVAEHRAKLESVRRTFLRRILAVLALRRLPCTPSGLPGLLHHPASVGAGAKRLIVLSCLMALGPCSIMWTSHSTSMLCANHST